MENSNSKDISTSGPHSTRDSEDVSNVITHDVPLTIIPSDTPNRSRTKTIAGRMTHSRVSIS